MNEAKDRHERERQERERNDQTRDEELRRIPLSEIDKTKWPANVREISMKEMGGLGIDESGRLYWNGKPVEIIGQRLDLTWPQFIIAVVVAIATLIAAIATSVQAWTAYSDWACKVGWAVHIKCPPQRPLLPVRPSPQ